MSTNFIKFDRNTIENIRKKCLVVSTIDLINNGLIDNEAGEKGYQYIKIKSINEIKKLLRVANNSGEYRNRFGENGVEYDPSIQQLIMYGYVIRGDGRFLIYQRAGEEDYDEERLAGKISLGIGGHMEPTDLGLARSFYRELDEEAQIIIDNKVLNFTNDGQLDLVLLKKYIRISLVGFIKDERDEAGKVHFGIVCKIVPKAENIEVVIKTGQGQENVRWQYVTLQEYTDMLNTGQIIPEGWTDILFREEILCSSYEETFQLISSRS